MIEGPWQGAAIVRREAGRDQDADAFLRDYMNDNRASPMPVFKFDFEFLNARYEFELQRKEQLTTGLTLPVGVLGGLGSLLALMARSFSYSRSFLTWSFIPILTLAIIAFFVCLLYLARAYHRQTYVFLPLLVEIESSRAEFLKFAPIMAGGEAEVLDEFEKQMRERMIAAADRNTETNDERSGLLHRARLALFSVLFLTAVAGLPYVIDQLRILDMPRPTDTRPVPQSSTPSATPQLPTVPPNREIREGDAPTRR